MTVVHDRFVVLARSAGRATGIGAGCRFAVLMVLPARRAQLVPRAGHVACAGIPGVAQSEPGDAVILGDDRTIGRPCVGVVHRHGADIVRTKTAAALHHHLILIAPGGSAA